MKTDGTTVRRLRFAAVQFRRAPGSSIYVVVLALTTLALGLDDSRGRQALLLATSTNLDGLSTHPLIVMVASAFWTPGLGYVFWLLVFIVASAPLERRVGTRRWACIFIAGHVGATLLTAGSIWLGITVGSVSPGVAGSLDVGVSYGIAAVVGYLLLELPRRRGLVLLAALCIGLLARLVLATTFTDVGHLYALAIGYALWRARTGRVSWRFSLSSLAPRATVTAAVLVLSVVGVALLQRSSTHAPLLGNGKTGQGSANVVVKSPTPKVRV